MCDDSPMENKHEPPPRSRVSNAAGLIFLLVVVIIAAVLIAVLRNTRPSQDTPNGMPQNIGSPATPSPAP